MKIIQTKTVNNQMVTQLMPCHDKMMVVMSLIIMKMMKVTKRITTLARNEVLIRRSQLFSNRKIKREVENRRNGVPRLTRRSPVIPRRRARKLLKKMALKVHQRIIPTRGNGEKKCPQKQAIRSSRMIRISIMTTM